MMEGGDRMKEEDFNISNHYALLAFRTGKHEFAKKILDILPETAKM